MSVAYMSSEESLSETAVSEWHEGNSSGSDEDLPNRENICVRPLSWQSIEVNGPVGPPSCMVSKSVK